MCVLCICIVLNNRERLWRQRMYWVKLYWSPTQHTHMHRDTHACTHRHSFHLDDEIVHFLIRPSSSLQEKINLVITTRECWNLWNVCNCIGNASVSHNDAASDSISERQIAFWLRFGIFAAVRVCVCVWVSGCKILVRTTLLKHYIHVYIAMNTHSFGWN